MSPEQIVWPRAGKPEDSVDKMSDDFIVFISRPEYTAEQVREAYYRLMGLSEGTDADPAIVTILTEMRRLEKEHYPVNRFAELISSLQKLEEAVPVYLHFVDSLPITTNEKSMLHSLVDKKRSGVLEITLGGKLMAKVEIRGAKEDSELMAGELLSVLKRVAARATAGQPMEVTFIE